jgi:amidohydrolase
MTIAGNDLAQLLRQWMPELVRIRRHLHQHPELSHQETKTTELVENTLKQHGITTITRRTSTGLWADFGTGSGPLLVLRAVIDALPIQEENDCSYRSLRRGVMHGRGHDGHVAVLLGVGFALKALDHLLPGTVRLIFQPAEDTGTGAVKMIEAGALSGPEMSEIFTFQLWPGLRQAQISSRPGPIMAGNNQLRIQIKGKSGHSAFPYQAIDAIVVAAQVITALQTVISRQSDPLKPVLLSIGTLQAGTSPFAIAETVEMMGTLRTFDSSVRDQALAQIERLINQITGAFGAQGRLEVTQGSPPIINSPQCVERVRRAVSATHAGDFLQLEAPVMFAEDFSRYLLHGPGSFLFVGVDGPGGGEASPLHSPYFDFDEAAFVPAIWTLLGIAADFFSLSIARATPQT